MNPADLIAPFIARRGSGGPAFGLNDLRECWLDPLARTRREPEVVPFGMDRLPYPDCILPRDGFEKMYDKDGLVLRVQAVINNPTEFRVRKQVLRDGKQRTEWVELRKGVAHLLPLPRGHAQAPLPQRLLRLRAPIIFAKGRDHQAARLAAAQRAVIR